MNSNDNSINIIEKPNFLKPALQREKQFFIRQLNTKHSEIIPCKLYLDDILKDFAVDTMKKTGF